MVELTNPIIKQWVDELMLWSRDVTALSDMRALGIHEKLRKNGRTVRR